MSPSGDRPVRRGGRLALAALALLALACLAAPAAAASRVDNPHGSFKENCQLCHTAASWKQVAVSPKFDHAKYGFPLTGAHAGAACLGCHTSLDFAQQKTQCASCHQDPHRGEMGADCARCHGARSFLDRGPMVRMHELTRFPLTGSHATVDCESCHRPAAQGQMQFRGTSVECFACHKAQFDTAPDHVAGNFSTKCQTCHNPISWNRGSGFDHAAAGFPLTGAHSTAVRACDDCHHGVYANTSKACESCHLNSTPGYANTGAGNPAHNATYFPAAQCASCHASAAATFTSWAGGTYTHAQMQLTNAHANRACNDCHAGNYLTVAYSCYGCHQNAIGAAAGYATATNPVHTPAYFPTTNASCTGCHNTIAWSPSLWPMNHSTTAFAAYYTGAHPALACTQCHNASTWATAATGNNCYGCHSTDYASAQPPHDPVNYPQPGCACHNTTTWSTATAFDHSSVGFPTTGQHSLSVRQCADCHTIIGYTAHATDKDCYTCHAAEYANTGAGNPVHNATYFPTATAQCTGCHASAAASFNSWSGGTYTHAVMQLTNAHANRACNDCHSGNYLTVAFSCYGCHQNPIGTTPGYATATSATHTPTYFPTDNTSCQNCHTTVAFSPSLWPMNHSTTAFAAYYTGAHPALACTQCHNVTTWATAATGNNCYGCHSSDYASAQPPHDPVNYPQAGCACHNTTTWSNATAFDHSTVGFPTIGQHSLSVRQCADCHTIIGYTAHATDKDCITCHAAAYNANGVLLHMPQYFPSTTTACTTCHAAAAANFNTWQGGVFTTHTSVTTSFSITNTNHGGMQCSDCHTAPTTDLTQYTCSQACHSGDPSFVGHSNQSCAGTTFSAAKSDPAMKVCYKCHPTGTRNSPC